MAGNRQARNQLRPWIVQPGWSTNLQNSFFIWQAIVTVGCFYSWPFLFSCFLHAITMLLLCFKYAFVMDVL